MAEDFDDLLAQNAAYAERFTLGGLPALARAGIALVTCMDSRIPPLAMLRLRLGDAKVIRTPGARVTPDALVGCILGVHLLGVERVLVVAHTQCAMARGDDADLRAQVRERSGVDLGDLRLGASPDQDARLREDVELLRTHPAIAGRAQVGGFRYDVDTGVLTRLV